MKLFLKIKNCLFVKIFANFCPIYFCQIHTLFYIFYHLFVKIQTKRKYFCFPKFLGIGHKRPYRYSTSPKAAPPIMCMIRSDTKLLRSRKESESKEKNCENSFEESKKILWLPAEIIKVLGRKTFIVRIDPTRTIKRVTNNHSNSNNSHKNVVKSAKYATNDEDVSAKTKEMSNIPVYVVENEPETEMNGYHSDSNVTEPQFIILDDLTNGVSETE